MTAKEYIQKVLKDEGIVDASAICDIEMVELLMEAYALHVRIKILEKSNPKT